MMIKRTLILLFVFLISLNASAFAYVITDPPGDQGDQEGDSINQKIDGKKEGYWIIWAHMRNLPDFKPNDKIEEGNYKTNRKIGMWKKYWANGNLKSEIEVFISSMFLPILESDDSVFDHRMLVLEVFARLCQDSYTVVELFINYDCSDDISSESGVFERIVGAMSKISQTSCDGEPHSGAIQRTKSMRLLALRSLVSLTKCMVEFTDVQPATVSTASARGSIGGGGNWYECSGFNASSFK